MNNAQCLNNACFDKKKIYLPIKKIVCYNLQFLQSKFSILYFRKKYLDNPL